jgi:hypothetical protein
LTGRAVEQRLGVFQIDAIEALAEAGIDLGG